VNATWEITPDPTSTRGEGLYQWDIQTTDADCPLTTGVRGVPLNQLAGYYAEDYYRPLGEDGPISSCIRWWLWVAHVELDNRNHTVEIPAYGNVTARGGVSTISSISCQPKFEMRKARIVTDGIKFNSSLIENSASSTLANVTAWNLLDSVIASKDRARSILRGTNGEFTSSIGNVTLHSDIFLLMNLTMPRKDREGWMDSSFLIESARKSFQSVATQVVLGSLVEPIEGNSTATLTWTENRLVLQALSFYLIVSLLIILIAVAAVLGFSTPIGVVPLDPGSIAGTAAIVASSFDLNQNLKTAGYSAAATKVRAMASAPYHAGIRGRRFCISSSVGQDSQNLLTLATTQRQKW
jgi:hypothetical protein